MNSPYPHAELLNHIIINQLQWKLDRTSGGLNVMADIFRRRYIFRYRKVRVGIFSSLSSLTILPRLRIA